MLKTCQIRTNKDEKVSVIQIPLNNFYQCLKLEDFVDDNYCGNIEVDDDTHNNNDIIDEALLKVSSVSADVPSTLSSPFEQVVSATGNHVIDGDIIVSSDDNEVYELMKTEGLI